jgi:serine protease Do
MMRLFSTFLMVLFAAQILLAGCSVLPVEKVPLAAPQKVPSGAHPAPVGFNEIRYAVPTGATTMGLSYRNTNCPLIMRKMQKRITPGQFPADDYRRIFRDTLGGLGYDVAGDPGRMFDQQEDAQRALYSIGARVTDIKMDVCDEEGGGFLTAKVPLGYVGESTVQIEWTVFDLLHRKNAYKVTTRGYSRLDEPNDEGVAVMLEDAFAAAAHNLGSDKTFFDLIFSGIPPAKAPDTYEDPEENALSSADRSASVALPPQKLLTGQAGRKMDQYRHVAVLIETAGAFGSGFFLNGDGYILTNAHVVGHAAQVRIVSADKEEKLIADVLRTDPARDVALLKLEKIPGGFKIPTLPVRLDRPVVSDEVYAVGSPDLTRLQDTVTKGIVSAVRYDRRENQWYIQSDVFTWRGDSGGPLLDSSGNIIGLCVAGYGSGGQDLAGLNLFIPIKDALEALDIKTDDGAVRPAVARQ